MTMPSSSARSFAIRLAARGELDGLRSPAVSVSRHADELARQPDFIDSSAKAGPHNQMMACARKAVISCGR
jgi:hypothetical protein